MELINLNVMKRVRGLEKTGKKSDYGLLVCTIITSLGGTGGSQEKHNIE